MRCEQCGAQLSLDIKICPYCGEVNTAAEKHVSDMNKYENEFKKTRWEVVKNSEWFSKYFSLITCLVVIVIINAILVSMYSTGMGYNHRGNSQKLYNKTHNAEIQEEIKQLMEEKEYAKVYNLYNTKKRVYENDIKKWRIFYDAIYAKERVYESILLYVDDSLDTAEYKKASWANTASSNLNDFYEIVSRTKHYDTTVDEEVKPYIDELKEELELFLKVYANCTDEDIQKISVSDQSKIAVILIGRVADEK